MTFLLKIIAINSITNLTKKCMMAYALLYTMSLYICASSDLIPFFNFFQTFCLGHLFDSLYNLFTISYMFMYFVVMLTIVNFSIVDRLWSIENFSIST